ncbi:MAG: transketolase C-terminal domain-containing protein [Patescibacteria group bacterium]|nr:transketolase C-terminal domain-containing protein [Patescibacteria group bacterium]
MYDPKMKLCPDLTVTESLTKSATRDGFGEGLMLAADRFDNVVGVCADVTDSVRMADFKLNYPDRFIQIGVSEQLLVALGVGLAMADKIPFVASFAIFCPGRAWEQIRTNVCLNGANVKIVGSHAGVTVGPDGASHQATEDIAIMRCIPGISVVVPCDALQAKKATLAIADTEGPAYLRAARENSPVFTTEETPFDIGKAQVLRKGKDVAIVACGSLVYRALSAAEELADEGLDCTVINNHTVKPLDEDTLIAAAERCGAVVTAEDHQIRGGMGSAVAEALAQTHPVPMELIGLKDEFGQSGDADRLVEHYGLGIKHIKDAARKAVERK